MSDLRKAAQAVIQAWDDPVGMPEMCRALDALRAALAEPTVPSECPYSHQPGPDEPCRYPDCVDNAPDSKWCIRWLLGPAHFECALRKIKGNP